MSGWHTWLKKDKYLIRLNVNRFLGKWIIDGIGQLNFIFTRVNMKTPNLINFVSSYPSKPLSTTLPWPPLEHSNHHLSEPKFGHYHPPHISTKSKLSPLSTTFGALRIPFEWTKIKLIKIVSNFNFVDLYWWIIIIICTLLNFWFMKLWSCDNI